MIERRGASGASADRARMAKLLSQHQERVLRSMKAVSNVESLVVDYPDLVARPEEAVCRLQEFLGPQRITTPEAMATVVKPDLHRQRAEGQESSREDG
jgi:hypothetical protein